MLEWTEPISIVVIWMAVFCVGECAAFLVFGRLRAVHNNKKRALESKVVADRKTGMNVFCFRCDYVWMKGVLERLVISVGLVAGYVHILTFFGALKIATGLTQRDRSKSAKANAWGLDYFLTGNLLSALFAMVYAMLVDLFQPLIFVTLSGFTTG